MNENTLDFAALRRQHTLSQSDLANIAKVSQATISRIESGGATPTLQALSNIANHLGVPLRELVPERQLRSLLGQDELSMFYAFCPNPFCQRNRYYEKDGQYFVSWTSGTSYPTESFDEINFCPSCGTELVKECPSCGRRLEGAGARYCTSCGNKISSRPTNDEWDRIKKELSERPEVHVDDEVPF